MRMKDVWLGKIVVPLFLKIMSVKEAYNYKKRRKKKKVNKTGNNGKKPQMYK